MLFYGRKMGESDEQNGGWFNEKSLNYCKNYIVSNIHNNLSLSLTFCCFVQGIGSIIGLVSLCFCYIVIYLTAP